MSNCFKNYLRRRDRYLKASQRVMEAWNKFSKKTFKNFSYMRHYDSLEKGVTEARQFNEEDFEIAVDYAEKNGLWHVSMELKQSFDCSKPLPF